jgi:hypothetical protein
MNTLSRVAVSFAAMVGLGPIFALAQAPPARPSRPPPSSPGSARARAPSWNALVTEDLARFMANAALNNSIKGMGAKGVGPVKMVCKSGVPINCTATQKACK